MMNKAVFLDRDGVLNKNVFYKDSGEWESPRTLDDFVFIDGVFDPLETLLDNGYNLFIVTNQPSFAKGKTTKKHIDEILDFCLNELRAHNINIRKLFCSYNHPDSIYPEYAGPCNYRKPATGSIIEAQKGFNLDLENSWIVGDRETDVECGRNASIKTIRIKADYLDELPGQTKADYTACNLSDAMKIILNKTQSKG